MPKVFSQPSRRVFVVGTLLVAVVVGLGNTFAPEGDTWNFFVLPAATVSLFFVSGFDLRAHLSLGVTWRQWTASAALTAAAVAAALGAVAAVTSYFNGYYGSFVVRAVPSRFTLENTLHPAVGLPLTFTVFFVVLFFFAACGIAVGGLASTNMSAFSVLPIIIALFFFGGAVLGASMSTIHLDIPAPVPGVYVYLIPASALAFGLTTLGARRGL
ncbi:hypothetical protein [Corynebacterium mastitidis]|uniref:hypothetical protein n=1 Tax=Corynebacterium mastitidis TaxID=161890 RepID=UPI002550486C|nr:hypothetical protein [Corynebacterium mastitidis]MDK8450746.1 hypothetical protein [Corynebacterium mastitidis]